MNKKIQSQVFASLDFEVEPNGYTYLAMEKAISRTIELIEEELIYSNQALNQINEEHKKQKAEFRKMIEELSVSIDDGFHPIEKYVNSRELLSKLGTNKKFQEVGR